MSAGSRRVAAATRVTKFVAAKRNRTAVDYAILIRSRENDLRFACGLLDRLAEDAAAIHSNFRIQRSELLRAIGQEMKRPQRSGLDLKFSISGKIRSPRVVWRTYVRLKQEGTKRPPFLNGAIYHRRQFEWTRKELVPHAHPAELDLVMETEAKLVWLRTRVLPLQEAARKLRIAVTQLKKEFARAQSRERVLVTTTQGSPGANSSVRQSGTPASEEKTQVPIRPQFRHPDGVL